MRNYTFICLVLNVFLFNIYSQKSKIVKVNNIQKKYIYIDTIKTYERVAEKGYQSVEMYKKMGDSYYFNSDLNKAARWYCELFYMTCKLESKYLLRYAESLNAIGNNLEANKIMEILNKRSKDIKEKN